MNLLFTNYDTTSMCRPLLNIKNLKKDWTFIFITHLYISSGQLYRWNGMAKIDWLFDWLTDRQTNRLIDRSCKKLCSAFHCFAHECGHTRTSVLSVEGCWGPLRLSVPVTSSVNADVDICLCFCVFDCDSLVMTGGKNKCLLVLLVLLFVSARAMCLVH